MLARPLMPGELAGTGHWVCLRRSRSRSRSLTEELRCIAAVWVASHIAAGDAACKCFDSLPIRPSVLQSAEAKTPRPMAGQRLGP